MAGRHTLCDLLRCTSGLYSNAVHHARPPVWSLVSSPTFHQDMIRHCRGDSFKVSPADSQVPPVRFTHRLSQPFRAQGMADLSDMAVSKATSRKPS